MSNTNQPAGCEASGMGLSPIKGHQLMMGRCLPPKTGVEQAGWDRGVPLLHSTSLVPGKQREHRALGEQILHPIPGSTSLAWGPPPLVSCGDMGWDTAQVGTRRKGVLRMWLYMLFVLTKATVWRDKVSQNFTGEIIISLLFLLFIFLSLGLIIWPFVMEHSELFQLPR